MSVIPVSGLRPTNNQANKKRGSRQYMPRNKQNKQKGVYYTPCKLAGQVLSLLNLKSNTKILEPSFGEGAFLNQIEEKTKNLDGVEVTGIEIDDVQVEKQRKHNTTHNLIREDFYEYYANDPVTKYDIVVGNPPYISPKYLTFRQLQLQSEILKGAGVRGTKRVSSWFAFLVAAIELLTEDGTVAFLLPNDFLHLSCTKDLRVYLIRKLHKVILLEVKKGTFERIQQDVLLFIGMKAPESSTSNLLLYKGDLSRFSVTQNQKTLPFTDVDITDAGRKWVNGDADNQAFSELEQSNDFTFLGDIAQINVGLLTGNNKYFRLRASTVEKYKLAGITQPLYTTKSKCLYFDEQEWFRQKEAGNLSYLLYIPEGKEIMEPSQQAYIDLGLKHKVNEGYKCNLRQKWYSIAPTWKADAFLPSFVHNYAILTLNKLEGLCTSEVLKVKFLEGVSKDRVSLAYINSITFATVENNGRVFGGGLLQLTPSDMSRVIVPNLENLADSKCKELMSYLEEQLRLEKPIESVVEELDKQLLVEHLGLSVKIVEKFNKFWLKAKHKRQMKKEK